MNLQGSIRSVAFAASMLLSLDACAPAMTPMTPISRPPARVLSPELQMGRLAERTAFEQQDASGAPLDSGRSADGGLHDADAAQGKRTAAFIGGVVAASLGGALAIGFGAAGQITERQLDRGYDEGLTRSEETDLRDRGKAVNGVAIGGAALAVVGIGLTAIILGIDYNRCGKLIKKRRKECKDEQP